MATPLPRSGRLSLGFAADYVVSSFAVTLGRMRADWGTLFESEGSPAGRRFWAASIASL